MSARLAGQVALVTGAARGIGRSVAERLAAEGAQVALVDREPLNVKDGFTADVTSRAQIADMVKAVQARFGRIDILVNNAAIGKPVSFLDTTDDDWSRIVDVNLRGYFVVGQEVARAMVSQGCGRIVNVASLAAHTANSDQAAYAASRQAWWPSPAPWPLSWRPRAST